MEPTLIAMDDLTAILLIIFIGLGGLLIGKLLDVSWRVWLLRQLTKVDWHVLAFISKDKKNIYRYAVNPDKDVVVFRGMLFVTEKGRIYREKKVNEGWLFSRAPRSSDEGVPVIYVDADSLRPITFQSHEDSVKPSEAGTVLTAWIENQINKNFEQRDKIFMVVCICAGLILLTGIMAYFGWQESAMVNQRLTAIEYKLGIRVMNTTLNTTGGAAPTISIPT
jgi:hypothetical protein